METTNLTVARKAITGLQFLFVAFGSTVLVPLLVGLDPATALFTAGLGTFIFIWSPGGKYPSIWAPALPLSLPSFRHRSSGACQARWPA